MHLRRFELDLRRILKVVVFCATCLALPVIAWAQWATSGNDIYNTNSNNVIVGASNPGITMQVNGTIMTGPSPSNPAIWIKGTGFTVFRIENLSAATDQNFSEWFDMGGQITYRTVNSAYSLADTYMQVNRNSGTYTIASTVFPSGNVGIGTTSPSSKLEVAGNVTVSGNISAKYQDLAEWVSTTRNLPAGTVVALDVESDNGIIPSSTRYDTHVAGVVSDSPGIILGQAGPGKLKIATTGRVKVRVDTSNGPIRRGDLLVTGTKEGTAMRSVPIDIGGTEIHRPGTLIGKALEPLETGEGEILVLLSLQ
jgi:hypothetical protein